MKRRDFLRLGAAAFMADPSAASAQVEKMRRIGILSEIPLNDPVVTARHAALMKRLAELGWVEGRNLRIDFASANEPQARETVAKELVAAKPDVLLPSSTPGTAALLRETRTIPIVFGTVADPIASGFVHDLAHPGGNATGFTNNAPSLSGKSLELLKEIAPKITRVGVLFNPSSTANEGKSFLESLREAGSALAVEIVPAPVSEPTAFEGAIAPFGGGAAAGLVVLSDSFMVLHRAKIVPLAAKYLVPATYPFPYFATEGGLMSYGVDLEEPSVQVAEYIDLILRGAAPGDLPVQAPRKFTLLINLKAAAAFDLKVPPVLLARADQVIE